MAPPRLTDQPDDERPVDPDAEAEELEEPGVVPDAERPVIGDEPAVDVAPGEQEDG